MPRPPTTPQPTSSTLDKVWLLENKQRRGSRLNVAFDARIRAHHRDASHAAPDDAIFLVLQVPPAKDSVTPKDSVHLSIHPLPGKYAFTLTTSDKLATGTRASFSARSALQDAERRGDKVSESGTLRAATPPGNDHGRQQGADAHRRTSRRRHASIRRGGVRNYALVAVQMTTLIDQCREAARDGYTRVPLVREVVLDGDTPVSAFAKLHRGGYGFLLESLEGGERAGHAIRSWQPSPPPFSAIAGSMSNASPPPASGSPRPTRRHR